MTRLLPQIRMFIGKIAESDLVFLHIACVTTCQYDIAVLSRSRHSLTHFTGSLSQFDMMALRSFGWAHMST